MLPLNYIGFEKQHEAEYSNFEIPNVMDSKNLKVENSLLYDYTQKQINSKQAEINNKR